MTTDLFTTLRAADPARGRDGYSDDELTRLAGEVARRADAEGAGLARPLAPPRPAARRLWPVLPAAAAVTLALVLGPALTGSPTASAEAVATLNEAADNITSTDPVADPSQWWEVTTSGYAIAYLAGIDPHPDARVAVLQGRTRTDYLAVDGMRPTVSVDGTTPFLSQVAGPTVPSEALAERLGQGTETWTSDLSPHDTVGTWQGPTPAFLAGLPRDPAALRDRLYRDSAGAGPSRDGEAFVYVADLLRTGTVPADLRGALYRVLATVPGVEVVARTASVGAATGVAFGWSERSNGILQEVVIDPATGDLVGERRVATAGDEVPVGTVIEETLVTRVLVDAVPADVLAAAEVMHCWADDAGSVACRNS